MILQNSCTLQDPSGVLPIENFAPYAAVQKFVGVEHSWTRPEIFEYCMRQVLQCLTMLRSGKPVFCTPPNRLDCAGFRCRGEQARDLIPSRSFKYLLISPCLRWTVSFVVRRALSHLQRTSPRHPASVGLSNLSYCHISRCPSSAGAPNTKTRSLLPRL